jgi:hypothetical protein
MMLSRHSLRHFLVPSQLLTGFLVAVVVVVTGIA